MSRCISVELRSDPCPVSPLLTVIDDMGFILRSVRLIPGDERSMLVVDIDGCRTRDDLDILAGRWSELDGIVEVIHLSQNAGP
jgi:hypothetical protein